MTWLALLASASVVALDWRSLRAAKRREMVIYIILLGTSLIMAVCFDKHLLTGVHLLAPVDALFHPPTKWLYQIL